MLSTPVQPWQKKNPNPANAEMFHLISSEGFLSIVWILVSISLVLDISTLPQVIIVFAV